MTACSKEGILPWEAQLGSMAVWHPQWVWLALGEQAGGIQALTPRF